MTAQFTYGVMRISQARSALSYYGYDAGGSTRELLNGSGAVTDTYAYDAFGNTVAQTGSTVNEFHYRGEQFDAGLGSYYLRARYYDPAAGRLVTQDKLEGRSKFPRTLNKYAYAISDPVDHSDPTGNEVGISYGIVTKNEGSGSAIAAAQNAAFSTCLLSPTLSTVTILANGTLGQYPLGTYPIVSACDGGFEPSGKMAPPGDCNPIQYALASATVQLVCHDNNHAAQVPCIPGVDDKTTCADKAEGLSSCIIARVLRDASCFRGGDVGHRVFTAKLIGYLEGCQAAWSKAPN